MKQKIRNIDIVELLPYISILLCTAFAGGGNWSNCILSLLLFIPYIIKYRKNIANSAGHVSPVILLVTGFIAVSVTLGDRQNSLYDYEKVLCLIFAFYIGLTIVNEDDIFKYIAVCSVLIAGVGLLAYCNLVKFDEFTFNDRYILRLQSFPKYANTTALILGCGYFSALKLFDTYRKKYANYLAAGVLIAFYLTVSKAAIPIFLALGTVLFIRERKYARQFILQNIICMVFTLLIILAGFKQWQTIKFLLIVACVALSGFIANKNTESVKDKPLTILWLVCFGVFLVCACAVFAIKGVNIFETLFKRFDYMKDALTLLKEHWFIGIGPGAWQYYQYSAQTAQYDVSYIHNSWLQLWLEYGIVFFLAVLAVTVKAGITFIKRKQYVLCAVLLFIAIHSFVDINLSYGLVLMILGLLLGFAVKNGKKFKPGRPIFYITAAVCCLLLGYMVSEYAVRDCFERAYTKEENEKSVKYALRLEKICPYDSNLQISLAALNQGDINQRIERAEELSPLDPEILETDIEYSISQKQPNVFEKCKKYMQMAPMQEKTYVKVKIYAEELLENELCTRQEYEEFLSYVEAERKEMGVIDRNKLLNEITEQKVKE